MPAKEIKALREAGKLDEAFEMANTELQSQPDGIWSKRNISWVYYAFLKKFAKENNLNEFLNYIEKLKDLQLPAYEQLFYDKLSWQIGMMAFSLNHEQHPDINKFIKLFQSIRNFPFIRKSEGYSFLFKGFLKGLKHNVHFIEFADWWNFENFRDEDFNKETMPNGKDVMAIAEQGYIAYAKLLLPEHLPSGETVFNQERVESFLPKLDVVIESHSEFQYPPYFKAKLLLALGDRENMLTALLPFAKKKSKDFWVWEVFSEAFKNEEEIVFACYCKALSCNSAEQMLVSLRQRMAKLFIHKQLFAEAKTEIELLVKARESAGFPIPSEVKNWQQQEWYKNATVLKSNFGIYKQYIPIAESLLYADIPEETIMVEFVNSDKKMLSFIASETKFGFFKYERFFRDVKVGNTLKVRFQSGSNEGLYQLYTAIKVNDEAFKMKFIKEVTGLVKIPFGKSFGFVDDIFIHPKLIAQMKLEDGLQITGTAIKSYQKEKKIWSWKLLKANKHGIDLTTA